ncbi:hypothetical protein GGX14DRAFT_677659 [Mycena pura]|uniref:Uncharacterized protein n=1 Tax=Mycena pura TaxID=153505 RepID=A0AAD6V1F6_9AGAR|nr:hypothetical protein GGX14DRAFT_677659 [Mycena pura]
MSSSTDSFFALPQYLQRRIDKAFDQCSSSEPKSDSGFFADSGGFLSEDIFQLPLSAVPSALQRLDLPPDDEQVLLVFKNAASGWKSSANRPDEIGDKTDLFVSRDDWRSVCAVLFEHHAEEYDESDGGVATDQPHAPSHDEDDEDDEYVEPDHLDSDSDEYIEDPSPSRRGTRRARSSSSSSVASFSTPRKLTARQRQTCLETYALFFPDASVTELPDQRIMIADIQRSSKLIGDKLKSEEIIEMLEEFSTSPDKSMSFADFGAMMLDFVAFDFTSSPLELWASCAIDSAGYPKRPRDTSSYFPFHNPQLQRGHTHGCSPVGSACFSCTPGFPDAAPALTCAMRLTRAVHNPRLLFAVVTHLDLTVSAFARHDGFRIDLVPLEVPSGTGRPQISPLRVASPSLLLAPDDLAISIPSLLHTGH